MSAKKYITIEDVNNDRLPNSQLTALEFIYKNNRKGKKERYVKAVCKCGVEKTMTIWGMIRNNISCGCYNKRILKEKYGFKVEDIIARLPSESRLTPLRITGIKNRNSIVECRCICGEIKTYTAINIIRGTTFSCGCYHKERVSQLFTKYPNANKKILSSYRAMIGRCYNENNHAFYLYGGKGVVVCEEWVNDYFSFEEWSLKNGWSNGLVIDKDIKGDGLLYSPQTCMWATPKQNSNKTSKSAFYYYNDKKLTLSAICEIKGVKRATIDTRLRNGMPFDKAINLPIQDKLLNLLNRKNKII